MRSNRGLYRSVLAVAALAILGLPSNVMAQTTPSSQTTASAADTSTFFLRAAVGKTVRITTIDGKQQTGLLRSVSGDGVEIFAANGTNASVPFKQVATITRSNPTKHLLRGALIGLGVGAGIALVSWPLSCEDDCISGGAVFGLIAGGLGAGMGISLGIPHQELVYDGRSRTPTLAFGPILSRTKKGVALTLTWR